MEKLSDMVNIGKTIENKLVSVGIYTPKDLVELGSLEAFVRLKVDYPEICVVHLYCLEGAILSTPYNQLDEQTKNRLTLFFQNF